MCEAPGALSLDRKESRNGKQPNETEGNAVKHPTSVQRKNEGALAKSTLNPRQAQFLRIYSDPRSATFGNAFQSAMAVGYSEAYANEVMSMFCETKSDSFRQVLDRAGVTDDAMARRHNDLLHSHEGSDIAAALRLGYQVKRHLPTAHSQVEVLLKAIGANQEEPSAALTW